MSAYESLKRELDHTAVISHEFKNTILGWTAKVAEEARDVGRSEVKPPALELPPVNVDTLENAKKLIVRLQQDIRDMSSSPATVFIRCHGCNRLHSQGWKCPTEGCEEGE